MEMEKKTREPSPATQRGCKVGIDYSTTSPAICINVDLAHERRQEWDIYYLTPTKKLVKTVDVNVFQFIGSHLPKFEHRTEKYSFISKWAIDILDLYTIETVYLEDYAYAATGKVFHIGENTGLLKYRLFRGGIDWNTVAPTAVKKSAVGHGNASKQTMIDQFRKETNIDLYKELECITDNPVSDIVDSYFICRCGIKV